MTRLEGESRFLPNLHFDLTDVQLCEVATALDKLEGAHRTRMNWMGPYSLEQSHLSIHALDLLTVLGHCRRSLENEIELFRLRRSAIEQITDKKVLSSNDIKIHTLNLWAESYNKLWIGDAADKDLTQPHSQPNRIELIP